MTPPTFPFEQTLDELESLVNRMETETLSLEDALKDFERGIALTSACQKALDEAEQKVKVIMQNTTPNSTRPDSDDDAS